LFLGWLCGILTATNKRITIMQIVRVPLRRINEALRLTLPLKLTRELGLRPGDFADLTVDNGKVSMRFVKVEPSAELAVPAE
jgi:hypothetical protein